MSPFHLFHLSLIGQLWWVLLFLVWVLFWLGLLLLHLVDQSLRSSYLPMTSLAQFRDCHSCYDERSIDQKKKAAKRIPMKKKHTVDLHTMQSRHGGNNTKSGCCITNVNVSLWSRTLRAFYMHSGARKRMLVPR